MIPGLTLSDFVDLTGDGISTIGFNSSFFFSFSALDLN
jgi:hypothetical protein